MLTVRIGQLTVGDFHPIRLTALSAVPIDYSGWPLYANASLPEETAYEVARAAVDREKQIVWEPEYKGIAEVLSESDSSPMDVPLHPGAERFWREYTKKK